MLRIVALASAMSSAVARHALRRYKQNGQRLSEIKAKPKDRKMSELLDIIEGRGKWAMLGPGITTYPLSQDDNQRRIHAECVKLAEQGRIYRHRVKEGVTIWMPSRPKNLNPFIRIGLLTSYADPNTRIRLTCYRSD